MSCFMNSFMGLIQDPKLFFKLASGVPVSAMIASFTRLRYCAVQTFLYFKQGFFYPRIVALMFNQIHVKINPLIKSLPVHFAGAVNKISDIRNLQPILSQ